MEGRRTPSPVWVLATISTSALCVSFWLDYRSRVLTGLDAPAPGSAASTAAEYVAALTMLVAAASVSRTKVPSTWIVAVGGVLTSCLAMMVFSGTTSELVTAGRYVAFSLIAVAAPRVWKGLSGADLSKAMAPIYVLLSASAVAYIVDRQYLFPWYNTWGLVAVLTLAHALTVGPKNSLVRHLGVGICLFGVAFSTSRQAGIALGLIAMVAVLSSKSVGQWATRLAAIAVAGGTLAYSLLTSDRVSTIGGLSSNGRTDLFSAAWAFISEHPFLGIGSVELQLSYHQTLLWIGQGWSASAHNLLLDLWIRGGLVGAFSCTVMFIALLRVPAGLLTRYSYAALASLPFLLLGSQLLFVESATASLMLGMAYGLSQRTANDVS